MKNLKIIQLGLTDYHQTWDLQKQLFQRVVNDRSQNYLIFTEHHPVITLGKTGTLNNLLTDPTHLEAKGIQLVEIDRGGDITFHGPGQLLGYPIFDLSQFRQDVHWYLRTLEEVVIHTLKDFDIEGTRVSGLTGVWVKNRKICAMGIKVSRWVTMHGFALNISTDLDYFNHIIPCGISNYGVTSILEEIGNIIEQKDVINSLCAKFCSLFNVQISKSHQTTGLEIS